MRRASKACNARTEPVTARLETEEASLERRDVAIRRGRSCPRCSSNRPDEPARVGMPVKRLPKSSTSKSVSSAALSTVMNTSPISGMACSSGRRSYRCRSTEDEEASIGSGTRRMTRTTVAGPIRRLIARADRGPQKGLRLERRFPAFLARFAEAQAPRRSRRASRSAMA